MFIFGGSVKIQQIIENALYSKDISMLHFIAGAWFGLALLYCGKCNYALVEICVEVQFLIAFLLFYDCLSFVYCSYCFIFFFPITLTFTSNLRVRHLWCLIIFNKFTLYIFLSNFNFFVSIYMRTAIH